MRNTSAIQRAAAYHAGRERAMMRNALASLQQHLYDRHDFDGTAWTVFADLEDAHNRLHDAAKATGLEAHRS